MEKKAAAKQPAPLSPFEAFVSAILAVPKEKIEQAEAKRLKRPSPKKKRAIG